MHRKTHVVTTSVLGGLLLTLPAFAQTTTTTTTTTNQHMQPVQTVHTTTSGTAHTGVTTSHTTLPGARGGGETASAAPSPGCPIGCAPVHQYTSAQREAARRARQERRDRLAQEQAQHEQELADCRARAEHAEADAQQLRSQSEQDRLAREREAQAERDRKAAEEREAALARERSIVTPIAYTTPRARGGGPNNDMRGAHLVLGIEGGVGGYTGNAMNALQVGPTWGARVGVNVMNWLGLEARYFGMWNSGLPATTLGSVGTVTNEVTGMLRLGLPTPYIRPYGLVGVGAAWNTVAASNVAVQQSTALRDNVSGVVPVGGGIDIPIGGHWGVGFEGQYHYYMNQQFTTDPTTTTGGQWHTSMNVHVNL